MVPHGVGTLRGGGSKCVVWSGASQSTSYIWDAQALKHQGALCSITHAGNGQKLQLPSAREKLQLLRAPGVGRESLPILVCFFIRESVASQVFPTKLNVARTDRVSKCHESQEHSCPLCRPAQRPPLGRSPAPLALLALGSYSCVFCSFGTYCLGTA